MPQKPTRRKVERRLEAQQQDPLAFLRRGEDQLRRAIEDVPIPIIMHTEDGQVLQISRMWTELTGYTLADIPTLETWLNLAYGKGAGAVRDYVREVFKGDKRAINIELPVIARDGMRRYWSFSTSSPGILRDGRRFIVGIAVDMTDRKQAQEALCGSGRRNWRRSSTLRQCQFSSPMTRTAFTSRATGKRMNSCDNHTGVRLR